jgi:ribosomal protein L11 methyltransferase
VLATDIDPWSVVSATRNVRLNRLSHLIHVTQADGWSNPRVRARGPYDLVFANILARPLCAMARDVARNLAPGGVVILAGLLASQARMVLAAHRRQGLVLDRFVPQGVWTTIVVRKPDRDRQAASP